MKKIFMLMTTTLYLFASPYNQKALGKLKTNSKDKSFSFVAMGDNRDGNNVLEKIIAKVNQDKNISFAINNGDLVPDGYQKEFKTYSKIITKSNKPFISVIGNHELPWYSGKTNYRDMFGKTNFSFTYGNSYFMVVDSSDKSLTKKQFRWLEHELEKSQQYTNRFVFTHVPLYDPRKGAYKKGHSFHSTSEAKRLNDMFDKYKITMIFASHIHMYYRGKWQNTPYMITGGAGAPLKHYKDSGFYHYVKVTVDDDDIKYQVIKINQEEPTFIQESIRSIKDTLNLN